jgi:hypothetical protein
MLHDQLANAAHFASLKTRCSSETGSALECA